MRAELIDAYDNASRLDNPPLRPAELRPPGGGYYVGYERAEPVAGGGLRRLGDGVAEIKRMYVRPDARSRGVAAALLRTLEDAARSLGYASVRLDTGPKQVHAQRLYRAAGYVEIPPYNDNPFACFWGEKRLSDMTGSPAVGRRGPATRGGPAPVPGAVGLDAPDGQADGVAVHRVRLCGVHRRARWPSGSPPATRGPAAGRAVGVLLHRHGRVPARAPLPGPDRGRRRACSWRSAAFLGALCGIRSVAIFPVVALCTLGAGLLVELGPQAALIGVSSVTSLVFSASFDVVRDEALVVGGVTLAGGIFTALLAVVADGAVSPAMPTRPRHAGATGLAWLRQASATLRGATRVRSVGFWHALRLTAASLAGTVLFRVTNPGRRVLDPRGCALHHAARPPADQAAGGAARSSGAWRARR